MLALALRAATAAVLLSSAALKLASPRASRSALSTFGVRRPWAQWSLWILLIALEAGLAAGVAADWDAAAYTGAGVQVAFAAALAALLLSGRAGAPCGCFGARSTVRWPAVARNLTLAAALAAIPLLPDAHPSADGWLALGLGVALLAVAVLAVAVLALARQVGELRLAMGSQSALELAGEGPEIGERSDLIERFPRGPRARFALAVFSSEGCPVCASLEPAVEFLGSDPLVSVLSFDEHRDAGVWSALAVPGAPYAVALGLDGTVLAKGTFNSLPQLESVLGTAERRTAELARA
ncbi:MAG: MauE/DoxX family redox-associated membrane protein [Thermoleophilaceae bacterium]